MTLDNEIIGWSEYDEGFDEVGVTTAINRLKRLAVGQDVMHNERIFARLAAASRQSSYRQAIGAIENAVLDAKAKTLGVPCYEILGGKVRDRIRVYWSHCGTWRILRLDTDKSGVRNLKDVKALGAEVRDSGFKARKPNIYRQTKAGLMNFGPSFAPNANPPRTPPAAEPPREPEPRSTLRSVIRGLWGILRDRLVLRR